MDILEPSLFHVQWESYLLSNLLLFFVNLLQFPISMINSIESLASHPPPSEEISADVSLPWYYGDPESALVLGGLVDADQEAPLLSPWQTGLVVLARVCSALAHICPDMHLCAIASVLLSADTVRVRQRGKMRN